MKHFFSRWFLLLLALLPGTFSAIAQSGSVGIGISTPAASAALDVSSTTKGFLPPRMDQAQRDAIGSPATGLTIYNTSTNKLNTWNGTAWTEGVTTTEQPTIVAAQTFAYTGSVQTYTVPAGIFSVAVDARGGQGGSNAGGTVNTGGLGARTQTTLAVTPGQVLYVYVGGAGKAPQRPGGGGPGGFNGGGAGSGNTFSLLSGGGGGGGASDVRTSASSTAYTGRLLVAAGGGGASSHGAGGAGGGPNGANGAGSGAGAGATQSSGNALGQGGAGATDDYSAGGGGGYWGGQNGTGSGSGGGGSSWVTTTGTSATTLTGSYQTGNGTVTVTPGPQYVAPALDGANFVNVPGDNLGNGVATTNVDLGNHLLLGNGGSTGLAITNAGQVGIGTTAPVTQLANTASNIISTDGNGVSSQAINWVSTTSGYAGAFANTGTAANSHGLAIKVAGTSAAALDVSQGSALGTAGSSSLLRVQADGRVGLGTNAPDASAQLEVKSTTRGLLPPRLTQTQRDAISNPAIGLTLYNTSTNSPNVWNGTSWLELLTSGTQSYQNASQTFAYTGAVQTYTVPAGVTQLTVTANGAQGASYNEPPSPTVPAGIPNVGGNGAQVQATLTVTPGEVLQVYVGGAGNNYTLNSSNNSAGAPGGWNGGGDVPSGNAGGSGGGGTDLRRGGSALANRVLVAGGGGGYGFVYPYGIGGSGGAPNGGAGNGNVPGGGATQTAGGNTGGTLGQGGAAIYTSSGAGGGGYYGGGSGGNGSNGTQGSGGGGSSWVTPTGASNITMTAGTNSGNGSLTITPGVALAAPVLNGANISGTWSVNGADVYRASGNVGIGTSTPQAGLHIDRPESGSSTALGVLIGGGSSGNPSIELRGSGKVPYIDFSESSGVDYTTRIISSGGVLNVNGSGSNGVLMQVSGGLRASNYANISDRRFKTNIRPLTSALASVLALRGVRYEWNALGVQHGGTAGAGQVGVIAQEVEKIYPELVSTDKDGYKAVNYAQLTPVLIEALKEQQAQIEALKQEVAAAKAKAATAEADQQASKARATASAEAFEARLQRLEAATAPAQARR